MAAPQGATTFIPYNLACAEPSTASRIPPPSRCRISVVAGLRYSEHALSRGNRARSTSSTDAPARASSKAVVAPAGPAPTTTTSQRLVTTSSRSGRRNVRAEHGPAAQRSQRSDTPRRAAGHPPPGGDEARRKRREGPDFGGPRVRGGSRDGAGGTRPRAEQGGDQGDAAVSQHLPRVAARAPALGELCEDATGEEESGE